MGSESLLSFWHEKSAFKPWDFWKEEGGNHKLKKKKSFIVKKVDTPGNCTPRCLFSFFLMTCVFEAVVLLRFFLKEMREKTESGVWGRETSLPVWLVTGLRGPRERKRGGCRQPFLSPASRVHACKGETQSRLHWEAKKPMFIEHLLWPGTGHSFAHLNSPNQGKVSIVIPVVQVRKLRFRKSKQPAQSHSAGGRARNFSWVHLAPELTSLLHTSPWLLGLPLVNKIVWLVLLIWIWQLGYIVWCFSCETYPVLLH